MSKSAYDNNSSFKVVQRNNAKFLNISNEEYINRSENNSATNQ